MDATLPRDDRWSRLAIRAMLRLVPRPHAAFLLAVPQAVAAERRQDEVWSADPEEERGRYRALAATEGLRVVANDGTFAAANDALFRAVMIDYMAGFGTPLNAVFGCNPDQKNTPDTVWRCADTRRELVTGSPNSRSLGRTVMTEVLGFGTGLGVRARDDLSPPPAGGDPPLRGRGWGTGVRVRHVIAKSNTQYYCS